MKMKIKALNDCINKLEFVKIIKNATNLGLQESKSVVESILKKPYTTIEIELIEDVILSDFYKSMTKLNWSEGMGAENYIIDGGLTWQRNLKLLQLGYGDKEDYVDFIVESNFNEVSFRKIIEKVVEKISISDLSEILKKYDI